MYLVGKARTDSEYGDYCGLDEIRLFHDLASAVRFMQENVEITHHHRDDARMNNPEWRVWYNSRPRDASFLTRNQTYQEWKAREVPSILPNPNPRPYDDYYVKSEYVVFAVEAPDLTVTVASENGRVINSLYTIEDMLITVRPVVVEDDLV